MNWNLNSPHVLCENTRAIMTQQLLSTSFLFLIEKRTVFRRRDCGSSVQLQASGWVLTDTLQPPLLEDELLISVVRCCLEHFVALYNLSLFIQDIILFYLNKHTQLWLYCWQLKPSHHVTNSLLDLHLALPLLPSCFLEGARVNLFGRDGGARDDILIRSDWEHEDMVSQCRLPLRQTLLIIYFTLSGNIILKMNITLYWRP